MLDVLSIHSTSSSRELRFEKLDGNHFVVELSGHAPNVRLEVWEFPDGPKLLEFFEKLGSYSLPWSREESWSSLEGEFGISASCTSSGHVLFKVNLRGLPGSPEEWHVSAGITSALGQLPTIVSAARAVFLVVQA